MKRTVVASCKTPGIGLGNRMTILCSAYAAAAVRGDDCVLYWPTGRGCEAHWGDLFKPMELVEIVSREPINAKVHNVPSYVPSKVPRMLRTAGLEGFTTEYWTAWRKCAQSIELIDELALPSHPERFTAVSIRSNWAPRAPKNNWMHKLRLPQGSFICTDSPEAHHQAMVVCENGWSLSVPHTKHDMGARDVRSMQAAARDMMMLTRASCILAIGDRSTFRNLAHIGYHVPVFKHYRNRNP